MRAFLKLFFFIIIVISYFITTIPLFVLLKIWPWETRKLLNAILKFYTQKVLKLLGVKVNETDFNYDKNENYYIICNHLSYIDILVIYSKIPSCFVTSIEVKNTPFLGQLTQLAGCLFVERRDRSNIGQEVLELSNGLKNGLNVVVFPEATSTNGESVLPFKRTLFKAALSTKTKILPLVLNYTKVNDEEVNTFNKDKIFWYSDMKFFPHLIELFNLKSIEVKLSSLAIMNEQGQESCHHTMAELGHEIISGEFKNITF